MTKTEIIMPDGFTIRPAELSDNDAVVALYNANRLKTIGEATVEADEFTRAWSEHGFDINQSTRVVVTADDQIVAYTDVWDMLNPPVSPWIGGCVHPDHEGQGLGTAILTWAIERAKQALPRCPQQARFSVRSGLSEGYEPAHHLLTTFGFGVSRHWWIMRIERQKNPPTPLIPKGITIRPMHHPEELEKVIQADDTAFRDHYGYVEHPYAELVAEWKEWIKNDKEFNPDLWFVAVDDATKKFAGICLCRHTIDNIPQRAHVDSLGVVPQYRKQGLGLAILQTSFNALWALDKQEITLGVDATSIAGATRLYEKAGMSIFRRSTSYEKELRPGKEMRRIS